MVKLDMKLVGAAAAINGIEEAADQMEGEVVYVVGTPLEYSVYQEVGTAFHAPQPYMRPAVNDARTRLQAEVRKSDDLDEALDNLATAVRDGAKRRAPVETGTLRDSITKERRK